MGKSAPGRNHRSADDEGGRLPGKGHQHGRLHGGETPHAGIHR